MTRRSRCRTRRRFQKRTKFLNFLLPLESPRRRPRRARVVVVVPLAFHPFLLTSHLLLTYLLTYLLTSRFQRRRRTQSDGILVVRSDVFFSKKRRRAFFLCLSLSLSLSLSLYSKGLSFSLVVFFVINNTIRALCSMPRSRGGGGLETDAASISLSL
jgi:hypothetical protein